MRSLTRYSLAEVLAREPTAWALQPLGHALSRSMHDLVLVPEASHFDMRQQTIGWTGEDGAPRVLKFLAGNTYVRPSGYRVHMEPVRGEPGQWRLVGTIPEGSLCHKPSTVSGGGKSEIAKSILDAISYSPLIIGDYREDMAWVKEIIERDYSSRFRKGMVDERDILSKQRSLGSVIKLLSPSSLYTEEYNAWLKTIPERIKALVFLVKRFYRPDWGGDWMSRFTVDAVNGTTGNILKFEGRPVLGSYLRVGRDETGMRRTFKLRQDFMPAAKVQWEDDISASVTVPASAVSGLPRWADTKRSIKFCKNVEARFFQRPDDAVIRGYDKQAEKDLSRADNFISNFEPLPRSEAGEMAERCVSLTNYSESMRAFVEAAALDQGFEWFVASDRPRMVDGAPSKNPRYLQLDPCYVDPLSRYLADLCPALYRRVRADAHVMHPVGATLPGRRNNPADPASGIRPLAVYGPIHYQDLPELFMDFVCSLTGKSPSTTGAGSEGALTKGPFNSLVPTTDLNNALLSFILTGYGGFTTAAGHIGRKYRMEHDISLLMPELWARMGPDERDPEFLKQNGYLEKLEDFEYEGELVPASRLGWRITPHFATNFMGRIFDTPASVFADDMLRPELQSMPEFVDGIRNIAEAQAKSASAYFEDGSIEAAIPPLKAILHVMAYGHYEGKAIHEKELRALFDRETVLASDWYKQRLEAYRDREQTYVGGSIERLRLYLAESAEAGSVAVRRVRSELTRTEERLTALSRPDYLDLITGSIGLDPLFRGPKG